MALERLEINSTEESPKVVLDKETGEMEISGRSIPENALKFFDPVHEWVKQYIYEPNKSTIVNINLEYLNSSSAKKLVEILIEFESIASKGKDVKVVWYYKQDDELMKARGKEFKSILELPFEIKQH